MHSGTKWETHTAELTYKCFFLLSLCYLVCLNPRPLKKKTKKPSDQSLQVPADLGWGHRGQGAPLSLGTQSRAASDPGNTAQKTQPALQEFFSKQSARLVLAVTVCLRL